VSILFLAARASFLAEHETPHQAIRQTLARDAELGNSTARAAVAIPTDRRFPDAFREFPGPQAVGYRQARASPAA